MDVEHGPWQSDDSVLTIHGRYDPRELPALFAHYRVSLVAYPSAGPETFSFTLSEAWAAGRPVFVPPFGALAERLAGTGAGWAWTDEEWRDEARMLVAEWSPFLRRRRPRRSRAASDSASRVPQPTLAAMAERTLARYDAAIARGPWRALRHDAGRSNGRGFETRRPRAMSAARVAPHARIDTLRLRGGERLEPPLRNSADAEWLARGRTHQWEGRPVDAMLCFRRASRADPRAPDPSFVLGEVLWQFGRVPDAIASWREAVRLDRRFLAPWQALAEASLATGDATGARDGRRARACASRPAMREPRLIAAIARLMDDEAAIAASAATIDRILELDPALAGALGASEVRLRSRWIARRGSPEIDAVLVRIAEVVRDALVNPAASAGARARARPSRRRQRSSKTMLGTARSRLAARGRIRCAPPHRRRGSANRRRDRPRTRGKRHARLCAAAGTPAVPLQWPSRTAGTKTRVVALVDGEGGDSATVGAALSRSRRTSWRITFVSFGTPNVPAAGSGRSSCPARRARRRGGRRSPRSIRTCSSISPE